jgi:hypothetical protein
MLGSGVLAAVCVLAVGASSGADPAEDPPPPLDSIPIEPPAAAEGAPSDSAPSESVPAEGVPRPIEEPEDQGDEPRGEVQEPETQDPPKRSAQEGHEANQDWIMLGVDYLIIFIPVVGGPLIAPLAQGLTHKLAGEALVQNEYPNWWMGTLAGYGVFALSGTALVGGYALAVIGTITLATMSPQAAIGAALGGLTIMVVGAALVLVEPAVFYFVARSGVRAAPAARAKRIGGFGEPDEDDETPELPIGWPSSAVEQRR